MKKAAAEILARLSAIGVKPKGLAIDSRRVQKGDVFLAFQDSIADRRLFIEDAFENGAQAIVAEQHHLSVAEFEKKFGLSVENFPIPILFAQNLRHLAGFLSASILAFPSEKCALIAVTGTNGKTSISYGLAQVYPQKCALIGTLGAGFLNALQSTGLTTPESPDLMRLLHDFVRENARAVVLEASSIGLSEGRLNGARVEVAVFTNCTRDHLDYHMNMENYAAAKMQLFQLPQLRLAVVNVDDDLGKKIAQTTCAHRVLTYGLGKGKHIYAENCVVHANGCQSFDLVLPTARTAVQTEWIGQHNIYNLLAMAAVLWDAGVSAEKIKQAFGHLEAPAGRLERVFLPNAPLVLVDFAHTPDALENALKSLKTFQQARGGKLWVVFGCGGNRDAGKRAPMGHIACQWADEVVITSDNPRDEEPLEIIQAIVQGARSDCKILPNRQEAIEYAIACAQLEDVILIAGKGHENYQEIQGARLPFSDQQCAQNALIQHWGGA